MASSSWVRCFPHVKGGVHGQSRAPRCCGVQGDIFEEMTECGFLHPHNTPTEEAAQTLSANVPHMLKEEGEKCIVWFRDESAYNTTEDTPVLWGEKGKFPIEPKG